LNDLTLTFGTYHTIERNRWKTRPFCSASAIHEVPNLSHWSITNAQTVLKEALFCTAAQSSVYSPKQRRTGRLIELRSTIEGLHSLDR
jgi:hypothetical protein